MLTEEPLNYVTDDAISKHTEIPKICLGEEGTATWPLFRLKHADKELEKLFKKLNNSNSHLSEDQEENKEPAPLVIDSATWALKSAPKRKGRPPIIKPVLSRKERYRLLVQERQNRLRIYDQAPTKTIKKTKK